MKYVSVPPAARVGNIGSISSGWEPPVVPVELRPQGKVRVRNQEALSVRAG